MKLNLRIFQEDDLTQSYVDWFSNEEVVRFSDNQYRKLTFSTQLLYIRDCLNNLDVDLYGIFDDNLHIGVIEIRGLKSPHKLSEISYVVGNINYWRRGVGHFAVSNLVKIARDKYKLHKLHAGVADKNIGSIKVLKKNGFVLEGTRLKHLIYNRKFYNQLDFGLIL